MKPRIYIILFILILVFGCKPTKKTTTNSTDTLQIEQVSEHCFMHTSYLETEQWGKVGCNGMFIIKDSTAIVFDTPVDEASSSQLISHIQEQGVTIKAVVPTHFHNDCLGGISSFYKNGIPSYALDSTTSDKFNESHTSFSNSLFLQYDKLKVECTFLGEGHTKDNIVVYYAKDSVLFGGCLVKSNGAGKGNLADANIKDWPNTVKKTKYKFKNAKIVIPGHGKAGGLELLDYTIDLFQE